jgi:hypothetical protein
MASNSHTVNTRKVRSKSNQTRRWKFEIIEEASEVEESVWYKLDRTLRPLIEAAREVLGDIYAASAKAVLQQKEAFEDHRAEQKARQRSAARKAEVADRAVDVRLAQAGTGLRNGLASNSKSHTQ